MVVGHEVAHHIQFIREATAKSFDIAVFLHGNGPRAEAYHSKRTELQADCLAGLFLAHLHAQRRLNEEQLHRTVLAVVALGDDFQRELRDRRGEAHPTKPVPHGTASERKEWLIRGIEARGLEACEPFYKPVF
jgi:predicted metalloprotease